MNKIGEQVNKMIQFMRNDVISIPEKKNYRERYKRISQSATFKRVYHNKSIGDVISVEN